MSKEEREARRWEDAAVKENAKLRVAQEREAKRMAEQADKERRAAMRKQDTERRRQCASPDDTPHSRACTHALLYSTTPYMLPPGSVGWARESLCLVLERLHAVRGRLKTREATLTLDLWP